MFPISLHPEQARTFMLLLAFEEVGELLRSNTRCKVMFTGSLFSDNTVNVKMFITDRKSGVTEKYLDISRKSFVHSSEFDAIVESEKMRLAEAEFYRREQIRVQEEIKKIAKELFPKR